MSKNKIDFNEKTKKFFMKEGRHIVFQSASLRDVVKNAAYYKIDFELTDKAEKEERRRKRNG